ncbi:TonB-dependent receptor [Adhaeribacter swui]|uniref:TonB-dependent receptor n=1 Tax=Adhaeribacter swui TaxID=2086471 RepID=A0A7G7GAX4_9BACT|nr:TonB-dependent receptor [Adhaeribacter swui]QNF34308.1 TonB-dependent receptor [Adhaeribacter swui]
MIKYFFLGWLLLGSGPLSGQILSSATPNCGLSLSGTVSDQHHGQALPAATLVLEELNQAVQTDADGHYHFHGLCPGVYHLKTTYVGFETVQQEIRLLASANRNLKLHPTATALNAVQVVGQKQVPTPTQASGKLEGQQLEQTRGESLGKALEQLAGVTTLNTGPSISKPVIHGLHSNRVLLLNNGVRQEGQQWGTEHAPEIDASVASRLTVVKGAAGVRYGSDAIGGVVLVEPAPLRDSVGTDAVINLVGMSNNRMGQVSGVVNHNFKKWPAWSLRAQGTLKRGGNTRTPNYFLKNTAFAEQNFSAAMGYNQDSHGVEIYYSQFNTRLGILSASHIGNLTDLQRAIDSPVPLETSGFSYQINRPYQQVQHQLLKISGYLNTGEAGKLTWLSSFQENKRAEYDKHLPRNNEQAARNLPELDLQLSSFYNELAWEHRSFRNLTGTIGLTGMVQRNQYSGRFFIPNYWNYTGGIYWLEKWQKNKWLLEAGARYDYRFLDVIFYEGKQRTEPQFTYHNFSGTLGGVYELNHHVSFRLNGGTAFRSPNVNELFSNGLHHGTASIEIGDQNLKPETAYNLVATAVYQSTQKLNAELSVYSNYIQNYIYLAPVFPATLTVRGAFPTFRYTQTNARFTGADVSVNYRFAPPLSVQAKASVVRARNQTTKDYLILIPPDRLDATLRYEWQKQKFKKFSQSFIQVGTLLVGEQTRVPTQAIANPNPKEETTTFVPVNGDYKAPPSGYALWQAAVGTTFQAGDQPIEISISGTNLLNTTYRDYLNRFRYFADEMGRNVVLRVRVPLNFTSN